MRKFPRFVLPCAAAAACAFAALGVAVTPLAGAGRIVIAEARADDGMKVFTGSEPSPPSTPPRE